MEDDGFLTHDGVVEQPLRKLFFVVEIYGTIDMTALVFILEAAINNREFTQVVHIFPREHVDTRFFRNAWESVKVVGEFEVWKLKFVFVILCCLIL